MSQRVTRQSGLPLFYQEYNFSKNNSKKLKRQRINNKNSKHKDDDSDEEVESQTQSLSYDREQNDKKFKTIEKEDLSTQTQEKKNLKANETKEEKEQRQAKEREEKQKKEEEEQRKKDEEDQKYIDEFKQRNNLTKGRGQQERIENYQNKHYLSMKKQQKKDNKANHQENEDQHVNGKVGLMNLGNTCFMNSGMNYYQNKINSIKQLRIQYSFQINKALQCLSNLQPLTDYCLQNKEDCEINIQNHLGSGGIAVKAFSNLMRELWTSKNSSVCPEEFLKVISYCNKIYSAGRQQDSQEFLLYLLDQIHEDLNRVDKKPYVEQKEYFKDLNQKELEKLAADSWGDYLKRNKSVIVDLFQGQMKNSLKCLTCKTTKYQFEPFMYLTVPITSDTKTEVTIEDCIKQFIEKEELDGDEKWYCPECKEFRKSEKKIDLWKLPPVLMICMKRFQYTAKSKKKITTKVEFPIQKFDMSNFIPKSLQKEKPLYDLFSVISHSGYLNYGHYVAYCKNMENKQWYLYNDSQTKLIQDPENQIPKQNAYVLFYQKSTVQLIKRQTLVEVVNWPHKV